MAAEESAGGRKVALVTGGSRGIGRGCVARLAESGFDVVINYYSAADAAEEIAEYCRSTCGVDALTVQADVGDREHVDAMFRRVDEHFGRIDVLVANAARNVRKPFVEMTRDDIAYTFATSLWGVVNVTQEAARRMVAAKRGGALIYISSVHHRENYPTSSAYNMAKGAGHALYKTLAAELVDEKIRVNIVEPGWIDTPGERKFFSEDEIREEGKKLPWGRLGTAEEIGDAVEFLASDRASYITGAMLRVDGGFVLPRNA